ncbi:MAG: hypothetical protein O7A07_07075 [Acidobacteria bacterium]|nr:hypothetical protein [Acidobacteriota bacterium]
MKGPGAGAARTRLAAGGLAGVLLLSGGCAGAGRIRTPALPVDAVALAARRPPLTAFRVELQGRVRRGKEKGRFRAGLGALPPDFRLDIFHPLSGATLMSLGVLEGHLNVVWPARGECLSTAATPGLMERLVGLPIPPEDLLPLLTGHVYRDSRVEILSLRHPPMEVAAGEGPAPGAADRLLVRAVDALGVIWEAELLSERQGMALRARRLDAAGTDLLVEYPLWREQPPEVGPGFPGRVKFSVPARNLRLDLEVRDRVGTGPPRASLLPVLPADCRLLTPDLLPQILPMGAIPEPGDSR